MERNLRLDYLRLFLSILVITTHCQPLFSSGSEIGWLISNGIARIVVPFFFIISGYFIVNRLNDKKAFGKYILRLGIVYVIWSVIYIPTYIDTIEPRSLITFALMGYYHLWFMPALILAILILWVLKKFIQNDDILLIIAIVLFIVAYCLERLSYDYRVYNNGIFVGLPLVIAGYYIRNRGIMDFCTPVVMTTFTSISLISFTVEICVAFRNDIPYNIFISVFMLCCMLFVMTIKGNNKVSTYNYVGKIASGIYYVHILIIATIIPLSFSYNIYKYPMIILASIAAAVLLILVNKVTKILL